MASFVNITTKPVCRDLTTLAIVKDELDITNTRWDRKLRRWITECSDQVAKYCREQFAQCGVTETFDTGLYGGVTIWDFWNIPSPTHPHGGFAAYGEPMPLILSIQPIASIDSVTIDGTVIDPSLYEFEADTGFVWLLDDTGHRQPWYGALIVVVYVGGYALPDDPDLPSNLSRSAVALVRHRWLGDDKDPFVRSENVPGILETVYVTTPPGDDPSMPPEIAGLLSDFRRLPRF